MFGGPGRKLAKDFTLADRGQVKYVYSLRLPLYKKVMKLVRSDVSATVACDKVCQAVVSSLPLITIFCKIEADTRFGNLSEVLLVLASDNMYL